MSSAYKQSGVDIDAGNRFVDRIKPMIAKTHRKGVLSGIGGYAGLFSLGALNKKNPILVSTTDGVGTKLKIALDEKSYAGLGQDLVAMCVNDLVCVGAEPLFFLDYYATSKLELDVASQVVQGMSESLASIHCALLGGETAEMPGIYQAGDFDLAGFAVGVVEQDEVIDGSTVQPGDFILGLASSGVHSNGFSLIRKIIVDRSLDLQRVYPPLGEPLGKVLLEPTRVYVNSVLALKKKFPLKAIAHITGGGLLENPPRVFPRNCKAVFEKDSWEKPPVFSLFQEWGKISEEEMFRVFNCGIGLILIVPPESAEPALGELATLGEKAWKIGKIASRQANEESVEFC